MLESITLKSLVNGQFVHHTIDLKPLTVFIGPNNSGKSLVLRELANLSETALAADRLKLLSNIVLDQMTDMEAEVFIESNMTEIPGSLPPGCVAVGGNVVDRQNLKAWCLNFELDNNSFFRHVFKLHVTNLDGLQRLNLTSGQPSPGLHTKATQSMGILFQSDEKRSKVRAICFKAFQRFVAVDPTKMVQLGICYSDENPELNAVEKKLDDDARVFFSRADNVDNMSDGVKAFTGIVSEVVAGGRPIIVIDEPEAYLHPSLARILGKELATLAGEENKRILTSTHSNSFLLGCIEAGVPFDIVRLTYESKVAKIRELKHDELSKLMRHPLLRSAGLLSALFYRHVIVTESDADRAFYQEINERLLAFKPEWGIPDCIFINAQNKQTVPTLVGPLRRMGIPAAGIVDIDVVKDGGGVFSHQMANVGIPNAVQAGLGNVRHSVHDLLKVPEVNFKREGGFGLLNGDNLNAANNFADQLASYGLFIVRGGELECWLKNLGAAGHGPEWLGQMFEKMGDDPSSASYVKPTDGDVWSFIYSIRSWLLNTDRLGIPEA